MAQENVQIEELAQVGQLKLTSRQIAYMRLLEMPVEQLKARIENELVDNAALEVDHERREAEMMEDGWHDSHDTTADDFYSHDDRADWSDAMRDYASEDDIPSYLLSAPRDNSAEQRMIDDSGASTFRDQLIEEVRGTLASDDDKQLMEYLVSSLDDDGLLKKSLYAVCDELELYHDTHTTPKHLEELLGVVQTFDPPGIGARSLQECLLIQARRKQQKQLAEIIHKQWKRLCAGRWDEIKARYRLTDDEAETLRRQLLRLNPRPGNAMGEEMGSAADQVTPDFYVEVDDDGHATVSLNREDIPPLRISDTFRDTLKQFAAGPEEKLSRPQQDALNYARIKISAAQSFIDNLRGRQNTMLSVMQAIVKAQSRYFATGDETLLRPLTMTDIATSLDFDLSAVSRVCNSKWVDTPYGLHPLKWYFHLQGGVVKDDGEVLEQQRIKAELKALVANEDKRNPLKDDELAAALTKKGFPIARRTVAKYREQLGVPVARLRISRI